MRRGTTPDYILTVPGQDLRGSAVYVTISQEGAQVTLTGERLAVEAAAVGDDTPATTIAFRLTQRETLDLRAGQASVQVRWIEADGTAQATEIGTIGIMPVLLEEVIDYAGNTPAGDG